MIPIEIDPKTLLSDVYRYFSGLLPSNADAYMLLLLTAGVAARRINPLVAALVFALYKIAMYLITIRVLEQKRAGGCLAHQAALYWKKTRRPISSRPELLELPLRDFHVFSSHNTYLPCNQNADIADPMAIRNALQLGVRVVELDVYQANNMGKEDKDREPVVVHGIEGGKDKADTFVTTTVRFEECISTIAKYAFNGNDDPLIICLELNTNKNEDTNDRVAAILRKHLGDRLLGAPYEFQARDFAAEPIRNFLGKVIVISGGGHTSNLSRVINGQFNHSPFLMNTSHTRDHSDGEVAARSKRGLVRIYPDGSIGGHLSMNYDPLPHLRAGAQIVALNAQTIDDHFLLLNTLFEDHAFVPKTIMAERIAKR